MSLFARLLHQQPAARSRYYSSFFSSKPGGGRYFNSAKATKPIVATSGTNKDGKADGTSPKPTAAGSTQTSVGAPGHATSMSAEDAPTNKGSPLAADTSSSQPSAPKCAPPPQSSPQLPFSDDAGPIRLDAPQFDAFHPSVHPQDYKLHQFFALHRPLLGLGQPPASSIFTSHPSFIPPGEAQRQSEAQATLDDPPEASPEADADAARQLQRALVMSRAGSARAWDQTLKRLGLDDERGRAEQAQALQREWDAVYMDSTRRKRKKKMKKHKLRKRRRLQRSDKLKK